MNAEWRQIAFGDFATLQRGADLPVQLRKAGKIPVLASNGQVGCHSEAHAAGPGVVTGRSGTIGKPTYIDGPYWPLNTVLWVSDFHGNNPRFTYFFFKFFDFGSLATGTSVPTLNRNFVHGIPISVPPIAEQYKIASILCKVDKAIEVQERLLVVARDLKRSTMHHLFTRGLRGEPQRETDIGLLPQSWDAFPLGTRFRTQLGKMLSPKAKQGTTPLRYLRNKNVQWGAVDLADVSTMDFSPTEKQKFLLRPGDLLICEGGVIGRCALWHGELAECYYQKALHRVRPLDSNASNDFLAHWFQFAFRFANIYRIGGASSTIAHLPEVQLLNLTIPSPPIEEQRDIASILDTIDRKIAVHERKRDALQELFKTLLHELMTGQIRVADLDIDTKEVAA